MSRALSASVLAALLAAIVVAGVPAAQAHPRTGTISIISAGLAQGSADLQVAADDTDGQQLTSMTVHIYLGNSHIADVTDMALTNGADPADQTWTSAAPLALAAGTYTMTVDAADPTQSATGLAGGTLPFIYTGTQITSAANPSSINFEGKTTVSGSLTGYLPGAATATAISGVPVYLLDNLTNKQQQIATTDSRGDYKATIRGTSVNYFVQTVTNSVAQGASPGYLNLGFISNYPTRISATVKPRDFKYGHVGQATMTGVAQYKAGATWRPFADAVVTTNGGMSSAYVPTDSQGRFTWTFVPTLVNNGTAWQALTDAPGVMQSQVYGSVHIAVPTSIRSFVATLNPFAILHVHGCAETTVAGASQPGPRMIIQYAAKPAGPWYRLGQVTMNGFTSTCAGGHFAGSLPVRLANAYYRASLAASPDFQPSVSKAVHLWKHLTRIVSLTVRPHSVSAGGDITVKGRLEWRGATWRGYRKRQILIVLRPRGSKNWYWIHKVNTNARGWFSKTFRDPVTADWSAVYEGDTTHFASSGAIRHVTVTSALAATRLSLWQGHYAWRWSGFSSSS